MNNKMGKFKTKVEQSESVHLVDSLIEHARKSDENIDYYMEVDGEQPVGATAIMAFRTQIFVTRSEIAVVKGIQKGNLEVVGIYDSQGKYLRG